MIRAADLIPVAPRALTPLPARSGDPSSPSSWFEGDPAGAASGIAADLSVASRGLSVSQHAERVLGHLCGDADDRA